MVWVESAREARTEETNVQKTDPYPELVWCPICGWRKCGKDSWNGSACKCGFRYEAAIRKAKGE
jgi:hypothetical protein